MLGLGDIKSESVERPVVAAFFDLQGFTVFCSHIDPHLSVAGYLSGFLSWIFAAIQEQTRRKEPPSDVWEWRELPFFTKFMGDGLLALWDMASGSAEEKHNLVYSCDRILELYGTQFLPTWRRRVADVPPALRCGIAMGKVLSIGESKDYVGPCINLAARLQKLAGLPISFAGRGFDPEEAWKGTDYLTKWLVKSVPLRGIGQNELVWVKKADFEKLRPADQKLFKDP